MEQVREQAVYAYQALTASFAGYLNTLFKITHIGTFNTSIQALALIFQVSQAQARITPSTSASSSTPNAHGAGGAVKSVTDRFYRTLYDSLLDPRLLSSSKQTMYLNLLFGAMKADEEINRVMAFVKRLCQLFGLMGVPFLSGALFLLGEVSCPLFSMRARVSGRAQRTDCNNRAGLAGTAYRSTRATRTRHLPPVLSRSCRRESAGT